MDINSERLRNNLNTIGEIGRKPKQGIFRAAFSNEYYSSLEELKKLMLKAGLNIRIDGIGNIFGTREGKKPELPKILVGSHLDTVINGGLYDGCFGIIGALELINYLNDNNIRTDHSIEIAAFNSEEANILGGTFGSRAVIGLIDFNDKNIIENISKYNLTGKDIKDSKIDINNVLSFIELHIEQGSLLDSNNIQIGVVNGIFGIRRYKIIVSGEANHSGTTPMRLRKDALVGAAETIIKINEMAKDYDEKLVATIGLINNFPNAENVIPGNVEMVLEIRSLDEKLMDDFVENITNDFNSINICSKNIKPLIKKSATLLDKNIMKMTEEACKKLNIEYQVMSSGAGHDAKTFAKVVPTGMVFIPSKDGKSHCPREYSSMEDIEAGIKVLIETVLNIDNEFL